MSTSAGRGASPRKIAAPIQHATPKQKWFL
jgi:hypothetical protein